jgi:O-antigen ligase/tetratricopeptide (TPR) repeat protein
MASSQETRQRLTVRDRPTDRLEAVLLNVVDGGLAVCIFGVPLAMGGRHPLGHLLLVAAAAVVALAWMFRQGVRGEFRWRRSPADWMLPAGLALLVLQLAPLGEAALARLSPRTGHILPLWTAQADPDTALDVWSCVSMTPPATRAAIPLYIAYGLLLLVVVQRIKRLEDVERLLRCIALSVVAVAGLGVLQWAAGNGLYFWFYQHPYADASEVVVGSFSNHNHFAHFLALGLGPLLAWLAGAALEHPQQGRLSRARKGEVFDASTLRLLALAVVVFAGLMSLSRGGAVALLVAGSVAVAVGCRAGILGRRAVFGLAAVAVLTVAALGIHGYDKVGARLADLTSGSLEAMDANRGRRAIWTADAKAAAHYLPLGAGVGSHAEVYPMYLEITSTREYTHAENSPLQLLLETGAAGLGLMLTAMGLAAFCCVGALRKAAAAARRADQEHPLRGQGARRTDHENPHGGRDARRMLLCAGAVSASLAADAVHAPVDFVWYVPACMMLVAVQAGAAYRLWQLAGDPSGRRSRTVLIPRPVGLAALLVLTLAGAWAIAGGIGPAMAQIHWDAYLRTEVAAAQPAAVKGKSAPSTPDDQAARVATVQQIGELEEVLQWDSDNARAHLRLAQAYLRYFDLRQMSSENAMPLSQIRAAAMAAGFTSAEAVDAWLGRALGDRRAGLDRARDHARAALRLCPLQGEAYLLLADLCFLNGSDGAAAQAAYIAQALAVRPYDGEVLMAAGKHAAGAGNLPLAIDYWQKAFQNSPVHRMQLIDLLAGRIPVEFLLATFQPDLDALRVLHAQYVKWAAPEQSEQLRQVFRQCTGTLLPGRDAEAAAARGWIDAQLTELRRSFRTVAEAEATRLQGTASARAWLEAGSLSGELGDRAGELESAEKAARADPSYFPARYEAARCLVAAGRYGDAQPHLNWCLQRRPNDARLHAFLREVVARRADPAADPAAGAPLLR